MSAPAKDRLFEAVHARYQQRYGAPILAHTDDEIFELFGQVVPAAAPDREADHVFMSVLTAIFMSQREQTARLRSAQQ